MNIKDVKIGMKIRICEDPSLSIKLYGTLAGFKRKLAGSVQTVKDMMREPNRIFIIPPDNNPLYNNISFDVKDLRPTVESFLPNIKAELFDPEKLVIE